MKACGDVDGRSSFARRLSQAAALLLCASCTLFAWQQANGAEVTAEAEGIIFERQQIMKQLAEDSDILGQIVAGEIPPDKLRETTRAIAQGAKDSVAAFEQKIPGGRSKPEVWTNYADYTGRMQNFANSAEEMAKIAETGNMNAVISLMGDALPCKQCHDIYRERKK